MLGYVTFHPSESLVNSEDIKVGRTSIYDFFHNYLIIYRSVNMKTLEVYVEIISYFGQMHDFVVRVDGKYRNRPGLRFLSQINALLRCSVFMISIRYRWSRSDYLDRLEYSINFRDNCMKSLEPFTAKYSRYVTEIMIDSDRVGVLMDR